MITYEYKCLECGSKFTVVQSIKDDPIEKCDKCGGPVQKLFNAQADVIYKGKGFYVNDYSGRGE